MPRDPTRATPSDVAAIVEAGTWANADTAGIWTELKGWAADNGKTLPAETWRMVNEFRKTFTAQRTGGQRFNRAPADRVLTPDLAPLELNPRDPMARDVSREYLAQALLTFVNANGEEEQQHVSIRDVWFPGMTVGDVRDAVETAAMAMAFEYGTDYVGHSISVVMEV